MLSTEMRVSPIESRSAERKGCDRWRSCAAWRLHVVAICYFHFLWSKRRHEGGLTESSHEEEGMDHRLAFRLRNGLDGMRRQF